MSIKRSQSIFKLLAISALCFASACSSPVQMVIKANRYGTPEEQIAYHQKEIEKYQSAVKREEENEKTYLNRQQMNDVRQTMSRKMQYMNKIHEHKKAIEELISRI